MSVDQASGLLPCRVHSTWIERPRPRSIVSTNAACARSAGTSGARSRVPSMMEVLVAMANAQPSAVQCKTASVMSAASYAGDGHSGAGIQRVSQELANSRRIGGRMARAESVGGLIVVASDAE